MINLLPPEQKKELENQEKLKILIHAGVLISTFFICLSMLFFALNLFLDGQLEAKKIIFNSQLQNLDLETEKKILEKNKLLNEIFKFEKEKKDFSFALKRIFDNLPEKIELKSISLEKTKERKIHAYLTCFAQTREDLIKLKEVLNREFEKVSFPPEIWFKEKDIDFTVSFVIK